MVEARAAQFEEETGLELMYSGLPHIRFNMMTRIAAEMKLFLLGSVLLSALILFIFFRSVSTMLLSLSVVVIGVIWSLGTIVLMGYRISLLTALIPPLVVVIGIPNCIYFLNKYHTSYIGRADQRTALVEMVSKMGVVTLFCNVAAAIGFAVFALTRSVILQEFGVVAGINIMALFLISLILLPGALSYLPAPKQRHTRYLDSPWLAGVLRRIERWVFSHTRTVYLATAAVLVFSVAGMLRLRSEGYVVDDLPKDDKVYTDLKFFERHFKGIMPLEVVVDARKRNGFAGMRALEAFSGIDSLSSEITARPETARPLSLAEGLKFARQAFYGGDSASYAMPNAFDGAFVGEYLRPARGGKADSAGGGLGRIMASYMDSARQVTRITVNMADVGSRRLPQILDTLKGMAARYIDTSRYTVTFTGTCVTFLEGSRYIINGLRDSILWAFLLISLCMLYLFRSVRILVCSLIPNLIPLMLTAGVMGWTGIPLKPSTVLVFSVALGIAIDVTIRFLVNYKQELPHHEGDVRRTVMHTIRQTGISIIYTSLVLIAGFIIFVFSGFGGTQALGWLTSLTLLTATVTNLVLLPVLLLALKRRS
jgi:predicted RND superfamily exporter protein